jgi:hypothetical protein
MKNNDYLNDWVFHFNPYTEMWAAIPKDHYQDYWNDYAHADILRSTHLNTLIDLLHKSKGDVEMIHSLTKVGVK